MTLKKGSDKSQIEKLLDKLRSKRESRGINAYKYCGVIKLKRSPVAIQKKLRSEWR